MASPAPDPSVIVAAEELILSLKGHTGSAADQAKAVRQLDKLRCLLHQGPDALMFQAYPVCPSSTLTQVSKSWQNLSLILASVPNPPRFEHPVGLGRIRRRPF
jgi:hypothetical protein